MTRMDDLGEEFTIKILLMISAMSNAVWVTSRRRAFRDYGIPVHVFHCMVA